MKYFGTITGLPGATTPAAIPLPPSPTAEERPRPNYLGLGLLCLAGAVVGAGIVYMVGRKKGR